MPSGYDPIVDQTFRWDEKGNPYQVTRSGKRSYPSPLVAAQYRNNPELVAWAKRNGVTIDAAGNVTDTSWDGMKSLGPFSGSGVEWNQQEGKWDKPLADSLYSMGVAGLVGGGIANAAMGGGGSAAAATQNAGQGAAAGTTAAADGLIPATFSSPAGMTVPVATQGGLGGITAPSLLDKLKDKLTDPGTVAGLAATIPALVGAAGGGQSGPLSDPTVQELLKMNLRRQQRTDPLHESVSQLSMAMLPTAYQRRG